MRVTRGTLGRGGPCPASWPGAVDSTGFLEGGARLSVDLERLAPCLAGVVAVATVGGIALGEHAAEAGDGRRTRLLASLSIQWEP